jgi:serine/threonine-protein kinase
MSLTPGTRIGTYEIIAAIGEGGMGQVYRAHDTKLNRDVALKILLPSVAGDPDRLARFKREAQVLAALNHPHIAHIHGFEDSAATHALVMELVEGPTLAERIAQGPVPAPEATAIAKQIAEALEAAHEAGIVHRDLKPANVKVREDGAVKVLDFGLAKAMDPAASSSAGAMNSPTLTARGTEFGLILGTAAYMAPEQAKGKVVDKRADIWAFGVVLFEMLAGQRAFKGEDVSDVLAAVLRQDIDWSALPKDTPKNLRRLLERCLERDPKKRLRDIGDAWTDLIAPAIEEPAAPAAAAPVVAPRKSLVATVLPWVVAVLVSVAAIAWALLRTPPAPARNVTRASVTVGGFAGFVGLSRDGTRLSYTTVGDASSTLLMLRSMDQFEGKPIPGATGAAFPMFSPEGQWVAYSTPETPGKIRKIPVTGGTSITICEGNFFAGSAWGDDDTIVFSGPKGLMRVPGGGGTPQTLTTADAAKGEAAHIRPQFLPGGKQLLFTVNPVNAADGQKFAVLDLAKGTYRTVAKGGVNGRFATSGHLTYMVGTTLFAVPFDLGRLEVMGNEVPVIEGVSTNGIDGTGDYTLSDSGLLVYVTGDAQNVGTTLAWANRKGATEAIPGQARQPWGTGRASPDGRRIANGIIAEKGTDIWVQDVQRGTPTRLTFGGTNDNPVWTPDGRRIVYSAVKDGKFGLYSIVADGSGKPELVLATDTLAVPSSVTPDGKMLLFDQVGSEKHRQIFVVALPTAGAPATPHPLHEAASTEAGAQVSPDGRWVAYQSNESTAFEIYVQPFPGPGAKQRISTQGGQRPRWSHSGRELLYWANVPAARMMSVDIPAGPALNPGAPKDLFGLVIGTTWDVTPDPDRFLVELTSGANGTTIATVTDWFEELRRRAPAKR